MKFKIGDRVIIPSLLDDIKIHEYTITKVKEDTIECGSSENTFYKAFVWPIEIKDELVKILQIRKELKFKFDESMKLIYELRNKISRM